MPTEEHHNDSYVVSVRGPEPGRRATTAALDRNSLTGIRNSALSVPGALEVTDLSFTTEGVQAEVRTFRTDRDSGGRTAALPYGAHPVTRPVYAPPIPGWRNSPTADRWQADPPAGTGL